MPYEFAALAAALCWVFASLLAADVSRQIGGMAFNRMRVGFGFLMLLLITSLTGSLMTTTLSQMPMMALSGIIGLGIGDSALFAAFKRLGPRRAQILYACNAPVTVVLGMLVLQETPSPKQLLGIVLVFAGVVIAIFWGKRASQLHRWEHVQGPLWLGIGFGLLAALGQALGSIIIKPALDAGMDPMAASTVRIGAAALMLLGFGFFRQQRQRRIAITGQHMLMAALNALVAVVIGVSLLLYAFANGDVGIASILSATTPVMILPWLWLQTRERPAAGAWLGALIAVAGIAAILDN